MSSKQLFIKTILISTIFSISNIFAVEMEEGVHYDIVSARKSDSKVVKEYFNYGCPGCYKSEPLVKMIENSLPEDASLQSVPFENHAGWRIYVEAFYIAEMLGILDKAHEALFHQVHVEKKAIANKDQLKTLFVKLGADEKRFDQAANSFQLNSKLRLARKEAMSHKILSTPSFVVNDYYRINAQAFKSNKDLVDGINELLQR
jgi:thiol:disulfide interchange protein DsbA